MYIIMQLKKNTNKMYDETLNKKYMCPSDI